MKRTLFTWLSLPALAGLLVFALAPMSAQQNRPMGKIHGQVINPTGEPQTMGTVNLSTDGGATFKYTFDVDSNGNFSGDAAAGTYMMFYRIPTTPKGSAVDTLKDVKVVAGEDTLQNDDMSRPEYIAKLPEDQRKQLEELKKTNAAAMQANAVIKRLNSDLKAVAQDQLDIDNAGQAAQQQLGASASKADIAAKVEQIKTTKYTDIASMMTKDTVSKPDEAILWSKLGYAQAGLKQYDDAITTYKKAVDLESKATKPRLDVLALAEAGLGEVYARTGKVPDATTAYDAAAKDDPTRAGLYLRNEAIIYYQQGNADAQVAAAQDAVKINPNDAILYFLIGNGLVQKATVDPKTQKIVLPPGCADAYQKYLELAPQGPFAGEVASILQSAGEKINSSYKAPRNH